MTPTRLSRLLRRHDLGSWLVLIIVMAGAWSVWPAALGGSTSLVVVAGSSMEPTYRSGDVLIMRKRTPAPGDVIAFRVVGRDAQIVHRVLERRHDGTMLVQGDNRTTPDLPLPTDAEVVGVAVARIPQGWVVLRVVTTPLVLGVGATCYLLARAVHRHQRHQAPRRSAMAEGLP